MKNIGKRRRRGLGTHFLNHHSYRRRLVVEPLEHRRVLATIVVNTDDPSTTDPDDDIISFRDAIAESNASAEIDTIEFADNVTRLEDVGLTIRAPVNIDGSGVTIASGFLNQATLRIANHIGTTIKNFSFEQGSNLSAAILIDGGSGHTIAGNSFEGPIGSNRVGLGVEVTNGSDVIIGGSNPGEGNLFTNLHIAIQVDDGSDDASSSGISIVGNLIGVDSSGTAIRNRTGIQVNKSVGTVIDGNTISANSTPILFSDATLSAEIKNNRIGLAPAEDVSVRNFGPVVIRGSAHEIDRNVMSGNTFATALQIAGSDNTVTNNFIGTNSTGTEALANSSGIVINPGSSPDDEARGNTIGPGNVISGNSLVGILIETDQLNPNIPSGNTIIGNIIGLSADKTNAIANGVGIDLDGVKDTTIGGTAAGDGNVIAGNSSHGIAASSDRIVGPDSAFVDVPTEGTTIQGNFIGVPADGAAPIPNGGDGIRFNTGVGQALIGSPTVAIGSFSNVIQGNTGHGFRATEVGPHANVGNKILGNGEQDVDTGPLGPNTNDDPELDGITNIPVLTEVREGSTIVTYTLEGAQGGQTFFVELFNELTGALISRQEKVVISENTFTETITGEFVQNVVAMVTPKNEGSLGQTSEQGKLAPPPGDLQIKGSYERDSNFGGDGEFSKENPSELQIEQIRIPFQEDDPTQENVFRFDVLLENESSEQQVFRLQVTEDGVTPRNGSPTVEYFRRSEGDDGEDITAPMKAGNASITLEGDTSEKILIKITRRIGQVVVDGETFAFDIPVGVTLKAFSGDNTAPDDTVFAEASSFFSVNSESDLPADQEALAFGIADTEPDVPGQQVSLRSAITLTNVLPGEQSFAFERDKSFVIEVENEPLPEIKESVGIVGTAATSVEIRGSALTGDHDGLVVNPSDPSSGGVLLSNIAITGFPGHGIRSTGGNLRILNSSFGVKEIPGDPDQVQLLGNGGFGVFAEDTSLDVDGILVAGNGLGGIHVRNGEFPFIRDSNIGVTPSGTTAIRSSGPGIEIQGNSGTLPTTIKGNTIGGHQTGVVVRDTTTRVQVEENQIGAKSLSILADLTGATDLSVRDVGLHLENTTSVTVSNNRVTASGDNAEAGILVTGRSTGLVINNNVIGNRFGDQTAVQDSLKILGRESDTAQPSNSVVRDNSIQFGRQSGIAIEGQTQSDTNAVTPISFIGIEGNRITHFADDAPQLDESIGIHISNAVTNVFVGSETQPNEKKNQIDQANIGIAISGTEPIENGQLIVAGNEVTTVFTASRRIGIQIQNGHVDSIVGNRISDGRIGVAAESASIANLSQNQIVGDSNSGTGIQIVDAEIGEIIGNELSDLNAGITLESIRARSIPTLNSTLMLADNHVQAMGIPVSVLSGDDSDPRTQFHLVGNTLVTDGPQPALEIQAPTEALRIERNVFRRGETSDLTRTPQSRRATVFIEPTSEATENPRPSAIIFNDVVGPAGIVLSNEAGGNLEPFGIFNNDIRLTSSLPGIPIDLHISSDSERGITTIEPGSDPVDGPNNLQPSPLLGQPESTTFRFSGAFSFAEPQVMLVPFSLRGRPNSRFMIEFALSDQLGTVVTDGGQGSPGIDIESHRTIITTDDSGLASQTIRIHGLDPRLGFDDVLTHLIASATRLQFDSENQLVLAETSEFSQSVPIRFVEPDSSNDTDSDGRIDRFEDATPGIAGESVFGDVNEDGTQDALQQEVVAAPVDAPLSVAPPGDALTRLLTGSIDTPASIEALDGAKIVGSGIVRKSDPDPEEAIVGDGQLNLVVLETSGSSATFRYTRGIPFFGFSKEMRTGVFVDGKEQTAPQVFAAGTETFPDGISIEFFIDGTKFVADVTIEDGSPFDFDDREGFVADPFEVSLGDALAAATSQGNSELIVLRSGESLEVTDADGNLLQSSVLADIPAAALETIGGQDGRITVKSNPGAPIVLPRGLFLLGNDGNDEFVIDGVFSTLLDDEDQSPFSANGRSGDDQLTVTGDGNLIDLTSEQMILRNMEAVDATGTGANSVSLNVDSVRLSTDTRNQLIVKTDIDDTVEIGNGWTLADTEIVDGELVRILTQGGVTLRSIGPSDWTNPIDPFDVNASGDVSALDALVVINELARGSVTDDDGNLLPAGQAGVFRGLFVDVLKRGFFSALDALVILNRIGREQNTAEGELTWLETADRSLVAPLSEIERYERRPSLETVAKRLSDSDGKTTDSPSQFSDGQSRREKPVIHEAKDEPEESSRRAVDQFFTMLSEA